MWPFTELFCKTCDVFPYIQTILTFTFKHTDVSSPLFLFNCCWCCWWTELQTLIQSDAVRGPYQTENKPCRDHFINGCRTTCPHITTTCQRRSASAPHSPTNAPRQHVGRKNDAITPHVPLQCITPAFSLMIIYSWPVIRPGCKKKKKSQSVYSDVSPLIISELHPLENHSAWSPWCTESGLFSTLIDCFSFVLLKKQSCFYLHSQTSGSVIYMLSLCNLNTQRIRVKDISNYR